MFEEMPFESFNTHYNQITWKTGENDVMDSGRRGEGLSDLRGLDINSIKPTMILVVCGIVLHREVELCFEKEAEQFSQSW